MKRFELVIETDGNGMKMYGTNDGFNPLELVALLDIKKNDIIEQFTKCENFTHHRVCKKGDDWVNIVEEGKT